LQKVKIVCLMDRSIIKGGIDQVLAQPKQNLGEEDRKLDTPQKIGKFLEQRRISQSITMEDACKSLKIRKFFLECIEKGHFEKLPGTIYTTGFIKSYSHYLGVDFEDLSSELSILNKSFEETPSRPPYTFSQPKNLLTKRAVILSVLLTILCLGVFFALDYAKQEKKVELTATPALPTSQENITEALPGSANGETLTENTVTISARKETWIRIVDGGDQLIVARLLKPQDFYRLETSTGFRLTAGEAGALGIYLADKRLDIPSLSGIDLLENLSIDQESLKKYAPKAEVPETP